MAIPYSRTFLAGVPWYSVLIVLGILAAVVLAEREEKRLGLPADTVIDLTLVVVPCGIIGARLYYVAMEWPRFAPQPLTALYIWEGGVAIYGAVIGGILGAFFYARRKKLSCLQLLDVLVPGVLLAQAIGRWGNYFNMEAYGPEIQNTLFQFFPAGVLIPGPDGNVWHMATFFYESLWDLCGAAALWGLRKKQREKGSLLCWYFLIYGSGRFIIEQLREDSLYLGGFRVSQMLSLALCAASAAVLLYRAARPSLKAFAASALGAALLLARWFCLSQPWGYAALLLGFGALCLCLPRLAGGPGALLPTKGLVWLLAALLTDGAGLVFTVPPTPLASFLARLHTLLCSATLPLLTGIMLYLLHSGKAKEDDPCPSES